MNFGKYPWQEIYDWFQENGTHNFPWRQYNIPENNRLYRVWISEIFLQQTQADRVVGYFTKIIQAFPDVKTLAKTDYDTFFPYYKGMGYYSRARNILKTAKILDEIYKEKLPKNKKQLIKLPGIGEYTARAILAFGYGEPTLAWDTNLEKIFSRYFFGTKERKLTDKEKQNIENDFKKFVVPKENPEKYVRDINNALMDFGRIVDKKTTDEIDWENYPIQSGIWYDTKGKNEIKTVKTRDIFPTPDAKIIVIL
ncbi:hypothetical protein KGV55_03415, partial [Candidatus Gracilibacteria bacterium]|nr:hypothetical protein [Candidatus Gracilibacteria bacterium]